MKRSWIQRKTPLRPKPISEKRLLNTLSVKSPYWRAVARADRAFSIYIRWSAANEQDAIRCYCGKIVPIELSDCSHYVDRRHMGTRYSEKNCAASCRSCNRFEEGNKDEFALWLVKKHGPGILDELHKAKYTITRMDEFQLDLITKEYRAKLKALQSA
jgi:hypothetical protein